ncbi:site-specific integrase [uncultured Bacteroides sp.]|uniref:site-specific integrase n=1 Tax=uncultured Bacteroides sp. TaxID=162156 RepID=UPI0025AA1E43|nr:site-specific integrase [uncultured Bacteroides sp.]
MRATFKILFFVNRSKEKNGIVPIMGRVTINGTQAQFSCKYSIAVEQWDTKANKVKGKSKEARDINFALDNIKAQIIKHYQRISDREAYVTAEMVRNAYQGIGTEYETLLRAFDKHNADFAKRVGKDRVRETLYKHTIARTHVANFIMYYYKRNDLGMNELTEDFLNQYCIYLRNELGIQQSTVRLYCTTLRSIVSHAHKNGLIPRDPFANCHISGGNKERKFLTEEEVRTLMAHRFNDPALTLVRDIFVFGCLTGISFIDIKNLTTDNLVTINNSLWISSARQKTKIPFRVKLMESACKIIDRYEPFRCGNRLFNVYRNGWTNTLLKQIAEECGINKRLTFHMSHHSYAVMAISNGMPIESVSKVLGHTKITTTQHYAKITTEKLDKDFSVLESKIGDKMKLV